MKAIETHAIINSFRSKVDRSLSFSAETPELTSEEKARFMDLQGLNVSILITPLDTTPDEILKIDKDVNSKTPGQRLRAVMFLLWKKNGESGDFEDYYRRSMEVFINLLKNKLD